MRGVPSLALVTLTDMESHRRLRPHQVPQYLATSQVQLNVGFEIEQQVFGPNEGDVPPPGVAHAYAVACRAHLTVHLPEHSDSELPDPAVDIELTFEVDYQLEVDEAAWPTDRLARFLEGSLQFQVWPYVREAAASALMRMNLPPLTIPQLSRTLPDQPATPPEVSAPTRRTTSRLERLVKARRCVVRRTMPQRSAPERAASRQVAVVDGPSPIAGGLERVGEVDALASARLSPVDGDRCIPQKVRKPRRRR
jgi:hypothetical protein